MIKTIIENWTDNYCSGCKYVKSIKYLLLEHHDNNKGIVKVDEFYMCTTCWDDFMKEVKENGQDPNE